VTVNFTVKKSNGAVVTASATPGSTGTAIYKLRLTKKDPLGIYNADASALSGSAATNFMVQFRNPPAPLLLWRILKMQTSR
jgi:hypothetical protein